MRDVLQGGVGIQDVIHRCELRAGRVTNVGSAPASERRCDILAQGGKKKSKGKEGSREFSRSVVRGQISNIGGGSGRGDEEKRQYYLRAT